MKSPAHTVRAYDPSLRLIERLGQYILTGTVAGFIILGVAWPEPYAKVWQLVLAHIVGGRAGNVLLGLNLGFEPWFIFIQCSLEDILILLLFYPPLVAGYRRAVEWRVLGPTLVSIRQTADRHKSKIEPYGVAGLMVFVIFPFWSTGALVGAMVGYLLGMRTGVTFAAVLVGNCIAVFLWVYVGNRMQQFSEVMTQGILVGILTMVLVTAVIAQMRRLTRQRRDASASLPVHDEDEQD